MHRSVRAVLTSSVLWALVGAAGVAGAAVRVPQVPVAGTALSTFLQSQGQAINVNTDQVDAQRQAVPNTTNFQMFTYGPGVGSTSVGLYNAALAAPALFQIMPVAVAPGWFAIAAFRTAPTRLVVNLFDAATALQGTTTHVGADASDFSFYATGAAGTSWQQDSRNAAGAVRMLVFNGTGTKSGNTWLAFETSATGAADYADLIALVNLSLSPVSDAKTTWGRVKALFQGRAR